MYNGHKSRAAWNVSLWLNNDEGLYRLAQHCIRRNKTKDEAAEDFMQTLQEHGVTETPDGVKYSKTTVRAALAH